MNRQLFSIIAALASCVFTLTRLSFSKPNVLPQFVEHPPLAIEQISGVTTEEVVSSRKSFYSAASSNFSPAPTPAWVARFNGLGNADDEARAIAIDGSGNICVTGYSTDPNGHRNYATIKYNNAGVRQWIVRYNGPGNNHDEAYALAIDEFGNVYVTGYSHGLSGTTDYATIKYDDAGVIQWVARYNGPASASDTSVALKLDSEGNVYIIGSCTGSNGNLDYLTIKYSNAGVKQWTARYNGLGNADDFAIALEVDDSGNVYVTGRSTGASGFYDYATIKYNNAGVRQWVVRYNGPGNKDDVAYALAVNSSGNVYVTGGSHGFSGYFDYATLKYNSVGIRQWVVRYNGTPQNHHEAKSLAVDDSGNVYVTGYSTEHSYFGGRITGYSFDYATIKYNNAGSKQWIALYDGPIRTSDYAQAFAIDVSGNVYVTGRSYGKNGNHDYATIAYNSAGVQQWIVRYNGPTNLHDGANAITVDGAGNIYVTGYSTSSNGTKDYVTIKYLEMGANSAFFETTDSESNDQTEVNTNITLPTTFDLAQNFPNPFNPTTTIRFEIPIASHVKLVIYNLAGELVRTLVDSEIVAGYHDVKFDASGLASGIYFSRLEAGAFTATRKMLLGK